MRLLVCDHSVVTNLPCHSQANRESVGIYFDENKNRSIAATRAGYDERGERKRITQSARAKPEAQRKIRELQRELEDGVPTGNANRTIENLLDFYVDGVIEAQTLSPNTVARDLWAIDNYLRPRLGRRDIRQLSAFGGFAFSKFL